MGTPPGLDETNMQTLTAKPLTAKAFAPFGDVIETNPDKIMSINWGMTERHHDLAHVDVAAEGGHPLINIFRSTPVSPGFEIKMVERHPLGSQAFIPMFSGRFFVVVADSVDVPTKQNLHLFVAEPGQGVNYARGTWHHPLLATTDGQDFLVVDRGGAGQNLEECDLPEAVLLGEFA